MTANAEHTTSNLPTLILSSPGSKAAFRSIISDVSIFWRSDPMH